MTTIGSLFSGIGGLDIGLELCGLGPVLWQCDRDPAARAVLRRWWPGARLYEDVGEIDAAAQPVALVCGGFPCQPHSQAGKRQGTADARWLWPEFARVVAALRPERVFVENVPGLRTSGLRDVLADLARLGFDAEWGLFSADEAGAPHRRNRLFLLAHAAGARPQGGAGPRPPAGEPRLTTREGGEGDLADSHGGRRALGGLAEPGGEQGEGGRLPDGRGGAWADHRFPPGPESIAEWAGPQPAVRRDADGLSGRTHRLRLLGNSCVPQTAALAFRELSGRFS